MVHLLKTVVLTIYHSTISVSRTIVLYGTVEWRVGGAIYQTYSKDLLLLHNNNGYDEITYY